MLALLPGLSAHGGIQRHCRSLCRVLSDYAGARGMQLDLLSLHDPDGWNDERFLARPLRGCAGSRLGFVARSQLMLARPYDLLVAAHVDFLPLVLAPRLLRPRAPLVTIAYGIEVWRRLPLPKRLGLRSGDRLVAISDFTARALQQLQGAKPEQIRVVMSTMDGEFLRGAEGWSASGRPPIPSRLLSIARLSRADADKGIDQVIAALPTVRALVPDVTYTVVGDGDDRPRLESLARERGVADITHFAGRVPDEQLFAHLSGADVFVLPSRKEGFGIVFLEAAAFGKPVIAGAHGGSPEVVVDGETGLLVAHGDTGALARGIVDLLQDRGKREAMGQAGLQRMRGKFSFERFERETIELLDELLRARRRLARRAT